MKLNEENEVVNKWVEEIGLDLESHRAIYKIMSSEMAIAHRDSYKDNADGLVEQIAEGGYPDSEIRIIKDDGNNGGAAMCTLCSSSITIGEYTYGLVDVDMESVVTNHHSNKLGAIILMIKTKDLDTDMIYSKGIMNGPYILATDKYGLSIFQCGSTHMGNKHTLQVCESEWSTIYSTWYNGVINDLVIIDKEYIDKNIVITNSCGIATYRKSTALRYYLDTIFKNLEDIVKYRTVKDKAPEIHVEGKRTGESLYAPKDDNALLVKTYANIVSDVLSNGELSYGMLNCAGLCHFGISTTEFKHRDVMICFKTDTLISERGLNILSGEFVLVGIGWSNCIDLFKYEDLSKRKKQFSILKEMI